MFIYHKNIGYNINVLQQTACLVLNPITVGNFAFSLIACWWVGLQTLWRFWLKYLSIDEMVRAWCFGCLSDPPGFTCWISFAPVFNFIYCWVHIFALTPFYIFYWPLRGDTSFVDHLWYLCLVLSWFRVCSLLPCGHLLRKGWPLGSCLWCLIVF